MAAWSKVLYCSCYELGHAWEPSCRKVILEVAKYGFTEAFKVYAPLYLVAAILRRKGKEYYLTNLLPEILQSTLFLGTNAFSFIAMFCAWRRLFGFYFFGNVFLCGLPATGLSYLLERSDRRVLGRFFCPTSSFLPCASGSYFAILLERRSRRSLLAIYMLNVATETIWRMLEARGMVTSVKHGEVLLFSTVMAVYMYLFKFLLGSSEIPPPELPPSEQELHQSSNNNDLAVHSSDEDTMSSSKPPSPVIMRPHKSSHARNSLVSYLPPQVQLLVHRWRQGRKHPLCRHRNSCLSSVIESCVRMFGFGYAVNAIIKVLSTLNVAFKKPGALLNALKHRDNVKLGAFLGAFVGIFKLVNCLLRWVRNTESAVHGLLSGFLAGGSMMFYKSSSIAMYLLSKLAETLYMKGIEADILPRIKHADVLIYTLSTSLVFHAAVFEPHNLKPAYWKFLLRMTHGRFGHMNRRLLEDFGTDANRLFPDYYPNYDPRYTDIKY